MYTWKKPRENVVTLQDGLEFRLKYHLNRGKGEGDIGPSGREMIFRKSEWTFIRTDGRCDSW